jgi:hypothetical protein
MRPGLRGSGRFVLLVIAAVAVAGFLGESGSSAPETVAANVQSYVDATGDNPGGSPDITTVRVSNDDLGNVEFRTVLPNRTDLVTTDFVSVYLDIDRSPATGCDIGAQFGVDWVLNIRGRTAPEPDLYWMSHFTGCQTDPAGSTPQGSYTPTFDSSTSTLIQRLHHSDVGSPVGFRFLVIAQVDPISASIWDLGGDITEWTYAVVIEPPRDRTPPKVKALASTGAPGGVAKLRYTVFEESGKAREMIQVFRAGKVVATKRMRMGRRSATRIYATPWRVPRSTSGRLKFCVRAWDAAGNRSKQSCAALRIR